MKGKTPPSDAQAIINHQQTDVHLVPGNDHHGYLGKTSSSAYFLNMMPDGMGHLWSTKESVAV